MNQTKKKRDFIAVNPSAVKKVLPQRKLDTQKWDYGHCLIIAGSKGMFGAAGLAALAALRGGAGLISLATPASLGHLLYGYAFGALSLPLPETLQGTIDGAALEIILNYIKERRVTSVVCGPGLGRHERTALFVQDLCSKVTLPMVLDADALNARPKLTPLGLRILTPHIGEFVRFLGYGEPLGSFDALSAGSRFAGDNPRAILVLKGFASKIFYRQLLWRNATGNPGMAKGGSGDVLSGLMGSFLAAQKPDAGDEVLVNAVLAAVHVHGLAGDLAARALTQTAMHAEDIVTFIPQALKNLGVH